MTSPAEAVELAAARLSNDIDAFPRQFGNYLLLQMLARGGMGEVYLAKQGGIAGIEKNCVVKTLRGHFTVDREYVNRFMDEARVVVHLNHRNICQVYDVGKVKSKYYLAMEHIVGRDLRALLQDPRVQGQFTPAMLLHIVCETLEALDYAHRLKDPASGDQLNVVHRDVSPQNIMLNFEGEVKLIDFGLAASSKKVEKTQPNVVMGKMAYMAPEQARGDVVDGRADLFAVAVLTYEMLVGERFYEGMSFEEMWGVAGRGGFRPRNWDSLNPQIRQILERGLATDLELRFQTCGDFKEALSNYLFQNQLRASARDMRAVMEGALGADLQEVRDLLGRYSNVRMGPAAEEESQSIVRSPVNELTQTGTAPISSADLSNLSTSENEPLGSVSPEEPAKGVFGAMPMTESTSQSTPTITQHQVPAQAPENTMILRDLGFKDIDQNDDDVIVRKNGSTLKVALAAIILFLLATVGFIVYSQSQSAGPEVATTSTGSDAAETKGAVSETGNTDAITPPLASPETKAAATPEVATPESATGGEPTPAASTGGETENAQVDSQVAAHVENKKPERRRARRRVNRRSRKTFAPPPPDMTVKPPPPPVVKPEPKVIPPFPATGLQPRLAHANRYCKKGGPSTCRRLPSNKKFSNRFSDMTLKETQHLRVLIELCEGLCISK